MPLIETSSGAPVIRNEIDPCHPLAAFTVVCKILQHRSDAAGDAALHVDCATAIEIAVLHLAGECSRLPGALVAGRHHVGVAGKGDVRGFLADARVEIFDIGGACSPKR